MATYEIINTATVKTATLDEQFIYGASRLGLVENGKVLWNTTEVVQPTGEGVYTKWMGKKRYEVTNYLGNVNAVIKDRKKTLATGLVVKYEAVIVTEADYYAYGMQMPGRNASFGVYRFAYNGMETDNETKGLGNSYTTEFRQYDPRLGRWLSLDPLMAQFPSVSPYIAFDNNPNYFKDLTGQSPGPTDPKEGTWEVFKVYTVTDGKVKGYVLVRFVINTSSKGTKTNIKYYYRNVATASDFPSIMNDKEIDKLRTDLYSLVTNWDEVKNSLESGVLTKTNTLYKTPSINLSTEKSLEQTPKKDLTHKESVVQNRRLFLDKSIWTGIKYDFSVELAPIYYETNEHVFDEKFNASIKDVISQMEKVPEIVLSIESHTSRSDPKDITNDQLSENRAKAAYEAISKAAKEMYPDKEDGSVDPRYTKMMSRISYKGKGESEAIGNKKVEGNDDAEDRRTEFNFNFKK